MNCGRFEVFMAAMMMMMIWALAPCCFICTCKCFGQTWCLHLQGFSHGAKTQNIIIALRTIQTTIILKFKCNKEPQMENLQHFPPYHEENYIFIYSHSHTYYKWTQIMCCVLTGNISRNEPWLLTLYCGQVNIWILNWNVTKYLRK
jgi:hypothetical protein